MQSDVGLDSVDYIRSNLLQNGRLEFEKIIENFQKDGVQLLNVQDAESHTNSMVLAEIVVKFLDHDMDGLDYNDDWSS